MGESLTLFKLITKDDDLIGDFSPTFSLSYHYRIKKNGFGLARLWRSHCRL
jgi:hypothetical protein